MTRILAPSGGGKYVKPKAVPRSSPKPHYVPIKAPPPAPATRPTSTRAGNNPRGVAVVTKAPPSKTITTGANPRGVQIKAPKYYVVKPPKPPKVESHSSGGGGILAAITPSSIIHTIEHVPSDIGHVHIHLPTIVDNGLKEVRDFPENAARTVSTIAEAGGHDLMSLAQGTTDVGPGATPLKPEIPHSELLGIAKSTIHQSFLGHLARGDVKGAIQTFTKEPIATIAEFLGATGVAGRLVGIAGREGMLGDAMKTASSTDRADRDLGPGIAGEKRRYSPNVLKKGAQVAGEKVPKPAALEAHYIKHRLNKRVDVSEDTSGKIHTVNHAKLVQDMHDAIRNGNKHASKHDQVAADVAAHAVQAVASGKDFIDELRGQRARVADDLENGGHSKAIKRLQKQHLKNIDEFLADPNVDAVDRIAKAYAERQNANLSPEMERLGLLEHGQHRMARLMPYVSAGHMDGTRILEGPAKSIRAAAFRVAEKERDAAIRSATAAEQELARVSEGERFRAGQLEGRYNRQLVPAERSNSYLAKVNQAKQTLESARENVAETEAHVADLKRYSKDKLVKGDVVRDVQVGEKANGKPITGVRRVTPDEIERHMRGNGIDPDHVAYVSLKLPGDDKIRGRISTALHRTNPATRRRTASGVPTGLFKPGHAALADSQLGNLRDIDAAKSFDQFVHESAVHNDKGNVITYKPGTKLDKALTDYAKSKGGVEVRAVPVHPDNLTAEASAKIKGGQSFIDAQGNILEPGDADPKQRFAMVPESMVDRYIKHVEANRVAGTGYLGTLNRAFRNTVLPFSPKWLVGNDVEGAVRTALVGGGPRDEFLPGKVMSMQREMGLNDAADRTQALMGGQHYGLAHRANEKAIGAGDLTASNHPLLMRLPGTKPMADLLHGYMQMVQRVYDVNREFEKGFDKAVLGAHMHREMRALGATWLQAAKHEEEFIKKLATGYADPKLAADAAHYIDKTLGQYNRFGPMQKRLINNWMPFAPWYWNAARFVYMTLPADHPLLTAALLNIAKTPEAQAQFGGREGAVGALAGMFGGHKYSDLLNAVHEQPGDALSGLGLAGPGGYFDPSRFLPTGAGENGPLDWITSQIAPQAMGPARAILANQDPFGKVLRNKNGEVTDSSVGLAVGLNELLMEVGGPLSTGWRILQHGSTPYSASTIFNTQLKPNTHHGPPGYLGGLNRVENPLYPTYINPSSSAASSGSSTGVVGRAGKAVVGRSGAAIVGRSGTTVIGR